MLWPEHSQYGRGSAVLSQMLSSHLQQLLGKLHLFGTGIRTQLVYERGSDVLSQLLSSHCGCRTPLTCWATQPQQQLLLCWVSFSCCTLCLKAGCMQSRLLGLIA